jgi:phosphoglucomutase
VAVADAAGFTDGVSNTLEVEVISSTGTWRAPTLPIVCDGVPCAEDYVALLRAIFDIESLRALFARKDFKFVYDAMHGGALRLRVSWLCMPGPGELK